MKRLVVSLAVLFALGAAACSDIDAATNDTASPTSPAEEGGTPTGEAPGDSTPEPVPGLFWGTADGPGGRAIEGTRCWGTMCVDMIGPITPEEPAELAPGEELTFQWEGGEPTTVTYSWLRADTATSQPVDGGKLAWMVTSAGEVIDEAPVAAPTEPGEYILVAFAAWEGRGDVSFGMYFSVE